MIFINNIEIALFLFIIPGDDNGIRSQCVGGYRGSYTGAAFSQFFIKGSDRNGIESGSAKFFRNGNAQESLGCQFVEQAFVQLACFIHFGRIRYDFLLHQITNDFNQLLLFVIKSKIHVDTNLPLSNKYALGNAF